jgi:acyl-CoA thioesterase FadM
MFIPFNQEFQNQDLPQRFTFAFYYEVTFLKNGIEKIAATGKTTQVMYDVKQQKTIEIPSNILEQWKQFEGI